MKNKKLFAILTLVCFMFTLMPVAAMAEDAVVEPTAVAEEATEPTKVGDETALKNAVATGGTIELTNDITLTKVLEIGTDVTINGGSHKITSSDTRVVRITANNVDVTMNGVNIVSTAERVGQNDVRGISVDNVSTAEAPITLTLNGCSVDFTHSSANDWAYGVNITGGSHVTLDINGGTYEGANVINIWGNNHIITINNGAALTAEYPTNVKYHGQCVRVENSDNTIVLNGVSFSGEHAVAIGESKNASNNKFTIENCADSTVFALTNTLVNNYAENGVYTIPANAGTVKLKENIETANRIDIIGPITLDGAGHKLIAKAEGEDARAINVTGANGVTIKNLTINASGQRAINIIQNATNVTIDKVTATAANYTVNVASSAPEAKVTIKNSILTGLNVVNVGAQGAKIEVNDTELICNDQNNKEGYAALFLNTTANGATITATGVTFDIKGDSKKAVNSAENGTITIGGSSENITKMVAYIQYEKYGYVFETLAEAVDYAAKNDPDAVIKIIVGNADVSTPITIPGGITLECEKGKTITLAVGGSLTVTGENDLVANTNVVAADNGYTVVEKDNTFTLEAKKFTVTWDVDGVTTTETVTYGDVIKAPADPTKAGYIFNGWSGYTNGMTMPAGNQTFKATWYAPSYDYVPEPEDTTPSTTPDEPVVESTTTSDGTKVETTTTTDSNGTVTEVVETTAPNGQTTTTTTVTLESGTSVTNSNTAVDVTVNEVESDVVTDAYKEIATDSNLNMVGGSDSAVNVSASSSYSGYDVESLGQPASVTVPVSDYAMSNVTNTGNLTLAKVVTNEDGTTSLEYVGGSYDEETGTFTAKVDEAGDYILVEKDDLVNIELTINDTTVKENGAHQELDVAPEINAESRTMLPLRYIGEALGCNVDWNDATRTITITQDGNVFTMTIDQIIPGFGAAPTIKDGRTLVPVRYISEMLGANVIWDPVDQTVTIVK